MQKTAPAFIRRSVLRERASTLITMLYVAVAIVLGFGAGQVRPSGASPMSSPSAIAILSSIAAGMMALTAIVFALAFLGVQMSTTAYSPRLVAILGRRQFLAHVLGLFTGTFIYSLVSIRSIDLAGQPGVDIAVIGTALVWLLASIAAFVLLLPELRSVTIAEVLLLLERGGKAAAERLYASSSEPSGEAVSRVPDPSALPVTGCIRHAGSPLYLCGLEPSVLVRCASEAKAVLFVPFAIGDAIIPGDRMVLVLGATRPIDERRVRSGLWLSDERDLANDPAFSIRLLVDIAIRALSPAVNDPSTAVSALDEIEALLRCLGQRRLEAHEHADDEGVVRLIRAVPSWDDFVKLALTEISQYGRASVQVQRRLAALVHDLSELLPVERRRAVQRFARRHGHDAASYDRQGLGHLATS